MMGIPICATLTLFLMCFGAACGDWPGLPPKEPDPIPADFPFIVFLEVTISGVNFSCSGTVIHPDWILTAAHCTYGTDKIKVFAGFTKPGYPQEGKVQERNGKAYHTYPGFKNFFNPLGSNILNDYSVIELDKSLDIDNQTVKVIELDDSIWQEGQKKYCIAASYGFLPELPRFHKIFSKVVEVSRGFGSCPCVTKKIGIRSVLCFVTEETVDTPCPGDSGGPMLCDHLQVGVASNLYSGCKCSLFSTTPFNNATCNKAGTVSVYNHLAPALDWIQSLVGETIPSKPSYYEWPEFS